MSSTHDIKSEVNVIRNASPLAAGFSVLDISHNSSSINTVESPMLAEHTNFATYKAEGRRESFVDPPEKSGNAVVADASSDKAGNSFFCVITAVTSHDIRNGVRENMIVEAGTESSRRTTWEELLSAVPLVADIIGQCHACRTHRYLRPAKKCENERGTSDRIVIWTGDVNMR